MQIYVHIRCFCSTILLKSSIAHMGCCCWRLLKNCRVAIVAQFFTGFARWTLQFFRRVWLLELTWMLQDFPSTRSFQVLAMRQPFWWQVNLYHTSLSGNSLGKLQPTCQCIKLSILCSRHLQLGRCGHQTWWPWHVLMTDDICIEGKWRQLFLPWFAGETIILSSIKQTVKQQTTSNNHSFQCIRRVWWPFLKVETACWLHDRQLKKQPTGWERGCCSACCKQTTQVKWPWWNVIKALILCEVSQTTFPGAERIANRWKLWQTPACIWGSMA